MRSIPYRRPTATSLRSVTSSMPRRAHASAIERRRKSSEKNCSPKCGMPASSKRPQVALQHELTNLPSGRSFPSFRHVVNTQRKRTPNAKLRQCAPEPRETLSLLILGSRRAPEINFRQPKFPFVAPALSNDVDTCLQKCEDVGSIKARPAF